MRHDIAFLLIALAGLAVGAAILLRRRRGADSDARSLRIDLFRRKDR